jgi:hypothetical protein
LLSDCLSRGQSFRKPRREKSSLKSPADWEQIFEQLEQSQSQSLLWPAQLMPTAKQRAGAAPWLDDDSIKNATAGKAQKVNSRKSPACLRRLADGKSDHSVELRFE